LAGLFATQDYNSFFLLVCLACGPGPSNFESGAPGGDESALAKAVSNETAENLNVARKLIKNGRLEFLTEDVEETRKAIDNVCKQYNAYLSMETKDNLEKRLQYYQEIRVPSAQFEALVKAVEALAEEIDSRNIQTKDVTEQFIDVEARLKTKKELEARYLALLKQAHTVNDILSIENQIATIRADVESMQGKLNYLQDQVSHSTLQIVYYQKIGTDFGFASRFVNALGQGWNNLLLFLIGVTHLWPFILLTVLAIWLVRRLAIRRKLKVTNRNES
jgi:hypothetical protein